MRFILLCDKRRHLVCLPYSVDDLHAAAAALGIKRRWFHRDHYDVPKRRIDEIAQRCVGVSPKTIVRVIRGEVTYHSFLTGQVGA